MHRDATSMQAWLARICIEPAFVLLALSAQPALSMSSGRGSSARTDEKPKIISALFFRVKYLRAEPQPVVFSPIFAGFVPCPKLQKRRRA
jgi:hypothetical protein